MTRHQSTIVIGLALLILVIPRTTEASQEHDIAFIVGTNPLTRPTPVSPSSPLPGQTNEAAMLLQGAIRTYQIFISSQDMHSCIFGPSCSRFGMSAIGSHGAFHGTLMTADRLQRCHGFGRAYYPVNMSTGAAIDYPLEFYRLQKQGPSSKVINHECGDTCGHELKGYRR